MSTNTTFSFRRGNLQKVLSIPMYLLGFLLSWFVPRSRNFWVFGSGIGVGEGALAVAQELRASDLEASISWMVADEQELLHAEQLGFNGFLRGSFLGFWLTLRAEYLVVTHGLGDVNRFGVFRARVINLWHGAPLKKLHLDSKITTEVSGNGAFTKLLHRMYRIGAEQVDLYAVGSATSAERMRSAFRVQPGKVQVFGDARLDNFVRSLQNPASISKSRRTVLETLGLEKAGINKPLVLYAPTWRDGEENAGIPTDAEIDEIVQWAEQNEITLVIRSHPLGAGSYSKLLGERVRELSSEKLRDITDHLGVFDCVVTDYSSIAIDFALTGRPIVWFAPDLAEYSATRGLYEPYEVTTEGRYATTWKNALDQIERVLDVGGSSYRAAAMRTQRLAQRFHDLPEGGAAARVLTYARTLRNPESSIVSKNSVFFESFYGTLATCNPLALDRDIALHHPNVVRYWSVSSERVAVPHGAIALLVGSPEWFAARRVVPLIIVNDWLRFGFRRKSHQFVLQTWHGTPLKKIALERKGLSLRTKFAIRRESKRWNALLAQNAHAKKHLAQSYRMQGKIIETGYPRNDQLALTADRGVRIPSSQRSARMRLGIDPSAKVVLYAPTWRDSSRATVNNIDVARLEKILGEEWVILARGHSRAAQFGAYQGDRIVDVTANPDVNDLIIASDVFITDYSSLMFDVSVACVPMLFFIPDVAAYRELERGFTLDFEAIAPGPLLNTTESVAEHLIEFGQQGSATSWVLDSAMHMRDWQHEFNANDDGQSARRVIEQLEMKGVLR